MDIDLGIDNFINFLISFIMSLNDVTTGLRTDFPVYANICFVRVVASFEME